MAGLENAIALVSRLMARAGGIMLLAAALLVAAEVLLRYTRVATLSLGTELSTYALAVGTTWALAHVVLERAHVRVDVLTQRLPRLPKAVLDIAALASLFAIGVVLSAGAVEMFQTSLRLSARANTTLGTALALPQGAWTLGLIWFTLVALYRTVVAGIALVRGNFAEVDRIAGAPSIDDEAEEAVAETEQRLAAES